MHTLSQVCAPGRRDRPAWNLLPLPGARQGRPVTQQSVWVLTNMPLQAGQKGVLYVEGRLGWVCSGEV